jgi:hypothetical protein
MDQVRSASRPSRSPRSDDVDTRSPMSPTEVSHPWRPHTRTTPIIDTRPHSFSYIAARLHAHEVQRLIGRAALAPCTPPPTARLRPLHAFAYNHRLKAPSKSTVVRSYRHLPRALQAPSSVFATPTSAPKAGMPRHRSYSETPQLLHNTISIGRDAAPRTLHASAHACLRLQAPSVYRPERRPWLITRPCSQVRWTRVESSDDAVQRSQSRPPVKEPKEAARSEAPHRGLLMRRCLRRASASPCRLAASAS